MFPRSTSLCARDPPAYHYDLHFDTDAESGDVRCADGNWHCTTNRYTTNEYPVYQDTCDVRSRDPPFSLAETDAWFAVQPDTPGYNCEERTGLYALLSHLPAADDLDKVETNDAQTVFSDSRPALKALQETEIEQFETLAAQTPEQGDPDVRDFVQKSLDIARHTACTSGTLTISKNGAGLQNIRLELIAETNKATVDQQSHGGPGREFRLAG